MHIIMRFFTLILSAVLAACGGHSPTTEVSPGGRPVASGPFDTYKTQHNSFNRVRMDRSRAEDAATLAAFEDADPTDPAGYRNLIRLAERDYGGKVTIEVIAQVDTASGAPTRLLRLTADQAPFDNSRNGSPGATRGRYFFKGQSFAWVTIDDGPLLSGRHSQGLENLVLDFDKGTADIDIRTEVSDRSQVEIGLRAIGLPFDVVSGAFGGGATIHVRNPDVTETYRIPGHLRGNVGGSPTYSDGQHGMAASGLYTARGADGGHSVKVDGAFVGRDPNARP
ncbi:hypothetical protein SAMN05660710_00874 [Paracoccus tibetensis]|uniref:Viral aspartic protease n=2 Tax=Paracoccus tibetensis TaxID=336292 RepID=A0A1G5DMS0_9RHOB|nr:hypothetical protein SAMN05660710_00874 [Paracoccus tibetensis]